MDKLFLFAPHMTPLFTSPASDEAAPDSPTKPRGLVDKVMSVSEAVSRFVRTATTSPPAASAPTASRRRCVTKILRQKKQNLGFSGHTATHDFQILAAGNLTGRGQTLAKVDVAYVVGLEARGLSPHARREWNPARCR